MARKGLGVVDTKWTFRRLAWDYFLATYKNGLFKSLAQLFRELRATF